MDELLGLGEKLLLRFQSGDDDAFTEIVELYHKELANFINSIVNDRHETEHLTIETFARLAISRHSFAGKSSLKTYLFAIGKNLAFNHIKKRNQEQHISFDEVICILVCNGETPEVALLKEESRLRLHEAMQNLKEDHSTVLKLLYFEDMSYLQAGVVMNKSEKQIKHLAYRAKLALKKAIESNLFND